MKSDQRVRARIILYGLIVVSLIIALYLYGVQISRGEKYAAAADAQYARPRTLSFDRGSIFFQSKDSTRAAAATVSFGYVIYINPQHIANPEEAYAALANYITLDHDEFMRKAGRSDDPYEEIARRVDESKALSIAALSLSGVGISRESWRSYPGGTLASQTLGFVGENSQNTLVEGKYGLERTYESILSRSNGESQANALAGIFSDINKTIFGAKGHGGGTIVTTIEPTVEAYLEHVLEDTRAAWRPDEIGGVIIDPHTGEIVALSAAPSFDPNDRSSSDARVFSNPLVEHVYEMGSIMKPLTVAVGLDTGKFKPTSTYNDTGTLTLNGKKISNYDGKARGTIPIQQILSQSLNVGAATIALGVGKTDFARYFHEFGIDQKTNIDLPNEAQPITDNLESGRDIEIATASYGQGIALSPVAMARALSVLANGGHMIDPHIVNRIEYADGTSEAIASPVRDAVLLQQTVEQVTRMLIEVVDTALRGGALKMEHYTIAAKTGTAQIPDPVNGGYYTDRYLHSFFGYFPAYDPKFLVFLYQVHPKGAQFASETLADPFGEISKFLINYYNIAPDR